MKKQQNDHQPTSDWLGQALRVHLAIATHPVDAEAASPEFRARCRAAALGGLDVLKMRQQRPRVASAPGSLCEHFTNLACLAGVKVETAFQALGITRSDPPDPPSARGLATLARHLGLARDEAILRLRCSFAHLAGEALFAEWPGMMQPVRARRCAGEKRNTDSLNQTLRRREAGYSPSHRAELRAALNAAAEVYEQDAI